MSFSSDVKEELVHLSGHENHCVVAELAAVISFSATVRCAADEGYAIILETENIAVAKRFYMLLKKAFRFQPKVVVSRHESGRKSHIFTISVEGAEPVLQVVKTIGLMNNRGQIDEEEYLIDNPILRRTCCRRAFLRGAFLAAGSVTDPERNYHFEIACLDEQKAEQLKDFMQFFGLEAKIVLRKKYYVVYLKEGSMISDVLNIMEAHVAMMKLENIRIVNEVRNSVNLRVNCEAANINKTVSAARKQIEDIEYIRKTVGLDRLPENLRDVAYARLEEPDAALKELGAMLQPPVGKSGVNHRLRKLSQLAQQLREGGRI